ncbi:hypothetical protein VTN77DRAFT_6327 [Rasamsonia byssochlamydoides]|uniref:uncharacterized protein n=1 Tax=Rasamsonia byssochlamydoides TaxID=89139 RepID=UPI0037443198
MSRPLGLFLRSSRRVLPRILPDRRGYAVDSSQRVSTPRSEKDNHNHAGPSNSVGRRGRIREIGEHSVKVNLPTTKPDQNREEPLVLDYVQLRDACTCPLCVDPHSKQRNIRTTDIPGWTKPRSIRWEGTKLVVEWKHDIHGIDQSHVSTYEADYLRRPKTYSFGSSSPKRQRLLWNREIMEKLQHWITYEDYMNDDAKFALAMRILARQGLIFVKDIPDSRDMVERIATRMGPLRNTFYGLTWDVRTVPEAKNVAYTNQFLGFHMDLMYMKNPPGYQLLHCLKNSCEGGESLFVDTFDAAYSLSQFDFKLLTRFNLNYHYEHQDHIYHNTLPVIQVPREGYPSPEKRVIEHINYSPPFQAPFQTPDSFPVWSMKHDSDMKWSAKLRQYQNALRAFVKELEKEERIFELKLKPGECAIFENRRVAHARRAFDTTTGERWLVGAYVDEDAVLSRFGVLRRERPEWNDYRKIETQTSKIARGAKNYYRRVRVEESE